MFILELQRYVRETVFRLGVIHELQKFPHSSACGDMHAHVEQPQLVFHRLYGGDQKALPHETRYIISIGLNSPVYDTSPERKNK